MSNALVNGFYLSILIFWAATCFVSLGILLMLLPTIGNKEQKKIIFYLLAFNILVVMGFFLGFMEFFLSSLGNYNLFFIALLLVLIAMSLFLIIRKRELINVYSFVLLGGLSVLLISILFAEIILGRLFILLTSFVLLFAVITFYMAIFSSLCKTFCNTDSRRIFKKKKKLSKLGDVM